jgi:5-methylcytosine-specific restriction enzyme A
METWILTWNAKTGWPWPEDGFDSRVRQTQAGETVRFDWSCGRTKTIKTGDRVFLLCQGIHRGLIAAGSVVKSPYLDAHWDSAKTAEKALYIDADWNVLLSLDDVLPTEHLKECVPGMNWDRIQQSGIRVPEKAVTVLESVWHQHLRKVGQVKPGPTAG